MGKKQKKEIDSDVFRLAKPRRKGLLAFIFSRFLIIGVLLGLQIALIVYFCVKMQEYMPNYLALHVIIALATIIYLFSNSMDPTSKMTWMLIVAALPVMGTLMLVFTKMNFGNRKVKNRVSELITATMAAIPQDEQIMKDLGEDGEGTDDLVKYLNRSGCFPAYKDTDVTYFPVGEDKFEALLEELKKAEKFIFMEYFIIEEGYMWGKILEILVEKVKAGVDVRVMYDGMCEMSTLPPDYFKLLEKQGIKSKPFSPIMPILSSHYNYRDHRKILVIDGKVAFNGGVNLADEYINRVERFGHWKDTAVMLKGPAVTSFTLMFLQMWNIIEETPEFDPWLSLPVNQLEEPETETDQQLGSVTDPVPVPQGYVIPYCDDPLDDYKVGETVYMDVLNRADRYVHIMTPYLILDGELETAIMYAAQRGIDVKLILPGIPDKKMAYALAKSHYKRLTETGVQIFEYTPGFVHAKVCVSDDEKAIVGTINLDYRSLYHHFECATYMYKTGCIGDIEKDFQETLAKCRAVTPETIKKEKIFYKVMGHLMKLIAPLM